MSRDKSLSRRQILKGAGAAVVGAPFVVSSTALGGSGRSGASERINVASIGVRNMGNNHLRTLLGSDEAQVVAICDVDKKIREDRLKTARKRYADRAKTGSFKGVKGYNDYRKVVARDDIDAVVVAVPDHNHAIITVAALKHGKDVYIEKPMTRCIKEGRIMTETVRRYGRVLQVGSQQRSGDHFRLACELVRNGRIGRLKKVKVGIPTRSGNNDTWSPQPVPPELDYDMWLGPAPYTPYHPDRVHYNFRFVSDYSGGDITNWGAHHLDIARWGIGSERGGPVEVWGTGKRNEKGLHDVFYDIDVHFRYASGVELEFSSGGSGTRFEGTDGWVYVSRGKLDAEPKSLLDTTIRPDEVHLYDSQGSHMDNFLRCVRERRKPVAPAEEGHRSATLCHLACIAMRLERRLKWDPVKEEFPEDEEANRLTWRAYREPWSL